MNPYADETPTGPLELIPSTLAMPTVKPLPPTLAYELAALRAPLNILAARSAALMAELDRMLESIAALQRQVDLYAQAGIA